MLGYESIGRRSHDSHMTMGAESHDKVFYAGGGNLKRCFRFFSPNERGIPHSVSPVITLFTEVIT